MTSLRFFDKGFSFSGLRLLAGTTAFILFGSSIAMAQSTFGSILGTVKDTSGAVIASCKITLDNTGTSAHRATLTDAGGAYEITNLEPGAYTIKVEAPSFNVATY